MKEGFMKRVLFVCLGNICRSPMAEGIFQRKIIENDLCFTCDSCGTSAVHSGEMADKRMREAASSRGYNLDNIRSRKFSKKDFDNFDYILVMDGSNYKDILLLSEKDCDSRKVKKITDYCSNKNILDVPDPYYGGENGFYNVIDILENAIEGFISKYE